MASPLLAFPSTGFKNLGDLCENKEMDHNSGILLVFFSFFFGVSLQERISTHHCKFYYCHLIRNSSSSRAKIETKFTKERVLSTCNSWASEGFDIEVVVIGRTTHPSSLAFLVHKEKVFKMCFGTYNT